MKDSMKLQFPAKSSCEAFARVAVAAFGKSCLLTLIYISKLWSINMFFRHIHSESKLLLFHSKVIQIFFYGSTRRYNKISFTLNHKFSPKMTITRYTYKLIYSITSNSFNQTLY